MVNSIGTRTKNRSTSSRSLASYLGTSAETHSPVPPAYRTLRAMPPVQRANTNRIVAVAPAICFHPKKSIAAIPLKDVPRLF